MSKVQVNIERLNDAFHFRATNESGNTLDLDASPEIGGENKGFRPMQLLLAAVGSCSAIDVVNILKKQKQTILHFDVEVIADREAVEEYSQYKTIHLHFKLRGPIDPDKAEKAVKLSLDKYCSVSKALEPLSRITHSVSIQST
ncbi:MAG: OsmC family protein [Bacteroidetes bacterium]|nr:OsmC family protein [Bacteroidota bacterium]